MLPFRSIAIRLLTFALLSANAPTGGYSAEDFSAAYQRWKSLESMGDYAAALKDAEAVRSLCLKQYGADHAHTGRMLTELANLYVECGKYKEAEDAGRKALAISESVHGKESAAAATALHYLGRADIWLRRFSQAEDRLKRSRSMFEQLDANHPSIAAVEREQCLLASDSGRPNEAIEHGKASVKLAKQQGDVGDVQAAMSLSRLGRAYFTAGQLNLAEDSLTQALEILSNKLGSEHPETGLAFYWLSTVLRETGRLDGSTEHLASAAKIFEAKLGPGHLLLGFVQNDYGQLANDRGDLNEAERCYEKSVLLKKASDVEVALTLVNLAIVYGRRKQNEKAKSNYERALKITENIVGPDSERTGFVLMNYAAYLANTGKIRESIELFERSLEIFEKHQGLADRHSLIVRSNLTALYNATGRPEQAEKVFAGALDDSRSRYGLQHPVTATLIRSHGSFLRNRGQLEAAAQEFRRCTAILEACYGLQHSDAARSLLDEAECLARLSEWDEAIAAADRGFRIRSQFATTVLPALSESEQLDFLHSQWNSIALNALSLASSRPASRQALDASAEWALNSKSIRWTVLSERARQARPTDSSELGVIIRELRECRERLASLVTMPSESAPAGGRLANIAALTSRIEELNVKISTNTPVGNRAAPWRSLSDVRNAIPEDSVLIEFICQRSCDLAAPLNSPRPLSYGVWLIPAGGSREVQFVNLGTTEVIDDAIREMRFAISQSPRSIATKGERQSELELRTALGTLAEFILRPLERHLSPYKNWIVSPDGELWLVPWATLPLEGGSYAVEGHSIRCVSTGRELRNHRMHVETSGSVIAADPDYDLGTSKSSAIKPFARLPGTAREAREVAPKLKELFKSDPIVYTDQQATELAVKQIQHAAIVLLSTHGFFFDVPPERKLNPLLCCGLAFAGANRREPAPNGNDGILTGMEICNINLQGTRLVVLSACQTGLGRVHQGEGVAGLRQAFQLAGAEAVLSSLWSVADEETATLMSDVFDELTARRTNATALQAAQLKMISARRTSKQAAHPYFWAAFSLTSASP